MCWLIVGAAAAHRAACLRCLPAPLPCRSGQVRKTRQPYVAHCVETAVIVEGLLSPTEDDERCVWAAACLHSRPASSLAAAVGDRQLRAAHCVLALSVCLNRTLKHPLDANAGRRLRSWRRCSTTCWTTQTLSMQRLKQLSESRHAQGHSCLLVFCSLLHASPRERCASAPGHHSLTRRPLPPLPLPNDAGRLHGRLRLAAVDHQPDRAAPPAAGERAADAGGGRPAAVRSGGSVSRGGVACPSGLAWRR